MSEKVMVRAYDRNGNVLYVGPTRKAAHNAMMDGVPSIPRFDWSERGQIGATFDFMNRYRSGWAFNPDTDTVDEKSTRIAYFIILDDKSARTREVHVTPYGAQWKAVIFPAHVSPTASVQYLSRKHTCTFYNEVSASTCDKGCKVYRCNDEQCNRTKLIHSRSYGCDIENN